ncbi:glycosyl hydrolase family 8 [Oricola sp.]|uniref:glycosyl hydrolase family 8 n=1 Tax=Oricola sp. TaxID=1979950 RepID=UPI0025EF4B1B|nr:glycosyl hydrolase family 8 [Oricola sp.]MCI5075887.1 glycosyl hydrolase family 8 [Oricola sp.]
MQRSKSIDTFAKCLRIVSGITFMLAFGAGLSPAGAQQRVTADEWRVYTDKFVEAEGRVVDNANKNITHSESQGYGLLLAYLAGQPADFARIWDFTRKELFVRDDGLAAWRWEPDKSPHISDFNNATDGDILIAYALARAGQDWGETDYMKAAAKITAGILAKTVVRHAGRTILLPGVDGFTAESRSDGPVVNPSYLIFEAFPVLAQLVPSPMWDGLKNDGLDLLRRAQFGPAKLPSEWVSLGGAPRPAKGFDAVFSYNAVRIPLYLVRAGLTEPSLLERVETGMADEAGEPSVIDLNSGKPLEPLADAGYRIIVDAIGCAVRGRPVRQANTRFEPTFYYPATLQLLTLAHLREAHPECL